MPEMKVIEDAVIEMKVSGEIVKIEPELGTKTVMQNGTYNASDENLDGYETVTVNVPGVTLETLVNPAGASDIIKDKEAYDDEGNAITGSFTLETEISTQDNLISQIQSALQGKAGSGGGLPTWIQEMDVQSYTPAADTNEELSFELHMQNIPNMIIILDNEGTWHSMRTFRGMVMQRLSPQNTTSYFKGAIEYDMGTSGVSTSTQVTADPTAANPSGVISFSNTEITVKTYPYGGVYCYWRAGRTYTIVALKV